MKNKLDNLMERRAYFNLYLPKLKGGNVGSNHILGNTCPSCGYPTLEDRASWEICSICFWEDDAQDDADADKIFGGPNGDYKQSRI